MKKMNRLVMAVGALLFVTCLNAQEREYSSVKNSFILWEASQEKWEDYYTYLNATETVLTGKDISFLNDQYHQFGLLLEHVDLFQIKGNPSKAQLLFVKIKSLEAFMDFAEVCRHNSKVFNVLNERSISNVRAEGAFYNDAKFFLSEGYVTDLIAEWNQVCEDECADAAVEDIKSTHFFNEFLRSAYGQQVGKDVFKTKVKERKQTYYRFLFNEFNDGFIDTSSRLVSNFFGFFRIRKGKLYKDQEFLADATSDVQPLDILLEKTPFRLTDKIIPGYWSHAAVYVGNKAQLMELGIWEHPLVEPHQKKIEKGACIIEALRTNVAINSFESFSNVDAYAQLRLREVPTLEEKQRMLLTVFAQIGKEYDFRFNVESSDKMVCTEIHYLAYEMLAFHPKLNLGAYSVSVDDLAVQGASNSVLKPLKLYIEGDKVTEELQSTYDSLIASKIEELLTRL